MHHPAGYLTSVPIHPHAEWRMSVYNEGTLKDGFWARVEPSSEIKVAVPNVYVYISPYDGRLVVKIDQPADKVVCRTTVYLDEEAMFSTDGVLIDAESG